MSDSEALDAKLDELAKGSKRAATISLLGFLLVLISMGYAAYKLTQLEKEKEALTYQRDQLAREVTDLQSRANELLKTQKGVLDFLGGVTNGERIRLVDPSVNWASVEKYIDALPAGKRKSAILTALLLAWKDLPFSLNDRTLLTGLDSPHFINSIISQLGIHVEVSPKERLSDAMMRQFKRADSPLPGDLIFYRGNVGSFVLMYIGPGSPAGKGVAVGTLQTGEELQVVDTEHINTPVYPFIGYFRVPYTD
jgi:cell wall-associated NlpC family hydrolase